MKEYIKELLKQNNMSMKDLSIMLGISKSAISQWNENNISLENLYKLSRIFSVSVEDIMDSVSSKNVPFYKNKLIEIRKKYKVLENIDYNNIYDDLFDILEKLASLEHDYEYYFNLYEFNEVDLDDLSGEEDCLNTISDIMNYLNSLVIEADSNEMYGVIENFPFYKVVFKDYYKIKELKDENIKISLMANINQFELDKMATRYYCNKDYVNLADALSKGANILYIKRVRYRYLENVRKDIDEKQMYNDLYYRINDSKIDFYPYYDVKNDKYYSDEDSFYPNMNLTFFEKAKMSNSDPRKCWEQYLNYINAEKV